MKNLFKIMLALALISGSAFANNGEDGTMDKLTNDSAFSQTEIFFDKATGDKSEAITALLSGILIAPVAVIESVVWLVVLPFNAIKTGTED